MCHNLQHMDGKSELTLDTDAYREGCKNVSETEQKLLTCTRNMLLSLMDCQLNLTPLFLKKLLAQSGWKRKKEPRRRAAVSLSRDTFCLGNQIL